MLTTSHNPTPHTLEPAAWLTVSQAAARAGVHPETIAREVRRGRLRAARIGGRRAIRVRPEWLDAWLEAASTPVEHVQRGAA